MYSDLPGSINAGAQSGLSDELSPLARVYLDEPFQIDLKGGSIPACAGVPPEDPAEKTQPGVYPRLRGCTAESSFEKCSDKGLSPLARVYLLLLCRERGLKGSIPACAGVPQHCRGARGGVGVYPRLRGCTHPRFPAVLAHQGLSPLARVYRPQRDITRRGLGSIPACAGVPGLKRPVYLRLWVYPRLRGCTLLPDGLAVRAEGLSPLARVYLLMGYAIQCPGRSIPACAGVPRPGTKAHRN